MYMVLQLNCEFQTVSMISVKFSTPDASRVFYGFLYSLQVKNSLLYRRKLKDGQARPSAGKFLS